MEREHVQTWAVGRNTPETSDGISTVPAKLKFGGIPTRGKIKMTFSYINPRELFVSVFEFPFEGGTCMASTDGGEYLGR